MSKSNQAKGINTKAHILKTARSLFYRNGFTKTTTREIAKIADVNLGLISYYYKNKAEIGLLIYEDIRRAMRKIIFDESSEEKAATVLLNNVIDLKLLITNEAYRELYLAISKDNNFLKYVQSRFIENVKKYMITDSNDEYLKFSCITISVVKPELVKSVTGSGDCDEEEINKLINYYSNLYALTLNIDPAISQQVCETVNKYYINIVDNFTPVIVRTSE